MKQYIVMMTQSGEGCDYTIACGKKYEIKKARENDTAESILKREALLYFFDEEYIDFENSSLSSIREFMLDELIISFEGEIHHLDVHTFIEEIENQFNEKEKEKQQKEDEAEFERLRAKLNR